MAVKTKKQLSAVECKKLLDVLKARFEKNMERHKGLKWAQVKARLELPDAASKLWSLQEMDDTGGEPDVVEFDKKTGEYLFYDCSPETPKDRRSLCYDQEALEARKENKPANSALEMANEMGIELLGEEAYRHLQTLGNFDTKTSSWLKTPAEIRKLGGAIFGDNRFGRIFVYHNGVQSYYGGRGFRGAVSV